MAKANFVKKAQKNIYKNGKRIEYTSLKGKRAGQVLTKLDRTVPENKKDHIFINAGESYYWWQFKNSPKQYSKTAPRQSQLTQSAYYSELYSITESIEDFAGTTESDIVDFIDEIKSATEQLRDDTQEKLDNMPESLQSSPTGELLQERIDALENAISEIENIDTEWDPDSEEDRDEEEYVLELIEELRGVSFE